MACSAPRWQSLEETHGAEQRTDGGDEPRVAAGRGRAPPHAAEPGAARRRGHAHAHAHHAHHAHHARRLRSTL